jgi:hypothetical protein
MPVIKAKSGVYCDYCKDEWGTVKDDQGRTQWHKLAMRQALITTISETHLQGEPIMRSFCGTCLQLSSRAADGSLWTIEEQIQYAKDNRVGQQLSIGRI